MRGRKIAVYVGNTYFLPLFLSMYSSKSLVSWLWEEIRDTMNDER